MKLIKSLKKLSLGIYSSTKRFPITLLFSSSVSIMLIIINETSSGLPKETTEMLTRITMTIALGIPLSLCAKVFLERKKESFSFRDTFYYGLIIVLQIAFYLFLLKDLTMVSITRYVGISLVFYLCFIYIPHFFNKGNFELYVIHIFTYFLITYIYSGVLYGGLSAILFAIDSLLGISINSEFYFYVFLIVGLVFAPAYFLAYIPKKNNVDLELPYSKVLKILLTYIVMPLLTIYALILYLYFVKIIITMSWPIGLVSHLVLWFSLILGMVLFFIYPIKNQLKWTNEFTKWAPIAILPILIMMFISMGIRINAYGVTENRYYVLVLGLWIFGVMIYLSLAKKRKNIILPISLSIVILLSVLGPFSSYTISQYSQKTRFENILTNNNMIDGGKIQPSASISLEDKKSISSILSYFESKESLNKLALLPESFQIDEMEETLGFAYESSYPTHDNNKYFYYNIEMTSNILNISNYNYLLDIRSFYADEPIKSNELSIKFSHDHNKITINFNESDDVYEKSLNNFAKAIYEKHGINERNNELPIEEMTIEESFKGYKIKYIFQNIGGYVDRYGEVKIDDIYFYLLIKTD